MVHDAWCRWPNGKPCLRFSTDGTRLGADIAHTMGTTSEVEIAAGRAPTTLENDLAVFRSDVDAEQADWDHDPLHCPDGGGCQDAVCIEYWGTRADKMYGRSAGWPG